jgi:glutamate 5-kinase
MADIGRGKIFASAKRVVVKIGSSLLAPEGIKVREERVRSFASQVAALRKSGREVIIVSSGAIASGMRLLGMKTRPTAVEQKQALAAVGQPDLMRAYASAFGRKGLRVAQVLLTQDDLRERKRFLNARAALEAILARKLIPIVNENDVVAVDEIRMGDNDTLSALVALLCGADLLVLLTDVDGLFRGDPRRDSGAARVAVVDRITAEVRRWAGVTPGSSVGSGGMATKLKAAGMVNRAGHAVLIARGTDREVLTRAFNGGDCGTLFLPAGTLMPAHKRWLAFGVKPAGSVSVDAGARNALTGGGKSLLPKGITRVAGEFRPGDAVSILSDDGIEFARGVTSYSSKEILMIKGLATGEIVKILGSKRSDEVVHRDRMVIIEGGR